MTEPKPNPAKRARDFLRSRKNGVLATLSEEMSGYPFGSLTPYAMTRRGTALIYVSDIAEHTRNMRDDHRVSLTVLEDGADGASQARGRATLIADAAFLDGEEAKGALAHYLVRFPEAARYAQAHGFRLVELVPKRLRFIGGFGDIFWVESHELLGPEPAWLAQADGVIRHMNEDHEEALRLILAHQGGVEGDEVELVALDPDGFLARCDRKTIWLPFPEPAHDSAQLRHAFVTLTGLARGASGPPAHD